MFAFVPLIPFSESNRQQRIRKGHGGVNVKPVSEEVMWECGPEAPADPV